MAAAKLTPTYLGFDFSTQQVKVIATNDKLSIIYEDGVKFDTDLPEFRTKGGVHIHDDNLTVTAPPTMWVKALDVVLDRMSLQKFDFKSVAAISGTGQQHGSVYWKKGARETLTRMQPDQSMHQQLENCFSVDESPVWMDSSTGPQCHQIEQAMGGPQKVADMTGAKAYERYTGSQIMKIFQQKKAAYDDTERISLVSSFAACLFLGDYAPIDYSDGSGMTLMDIRSKKWAQPYLDICADGLADKLGDPVPSHSSVGSVSSYLVDRYGFSPECKVVAFVGDNPASVAGMKLQEGEVIVSLGSSDTLFLWLTEPCPSTLGSVFVNPVNTSAYMALLCYKNGSLTRERIRDEHAKGSWQVFDELLNGTPKGNNGNIGIYFDVQEITPNAVGIHRFNLQNETVSKFEDGTEVRALIEGQFIAKRAHAESLGYFMGPDSKVMATGGASSNKAILQVISDVFNAPVFTQDVPNSACLGCAYRAKHGFLGGDKIPFSEVVKGTPEFVCVAKPSSDARQIYDPLLERYKQLEQRVITGQSKQ